MGLDKAGKKLTDRHTHCWIWSLYRMCWQWEKYGINQTYPVTIKVNFFMFKKKSKLSSDKHAKQKVIHLPLPPSVGIRSTLCWRAVIWSSGVSLTTTLAATAAQLPTRTTTSLHTQSWVSWVSQRTTTYFSFCEKGPKLVESGRLLLHGRCVETLLKGDAST